MMTAPATHSRSYLKELVTDRRVAAALAIGFSSGLPLLLVFTTLSAWLSDASVPVSTIGLLSETTLPYRLKFLWAPFLDRYDPPFLTKLFGRRRAWILVAQTGVMIALAGWIQRPGPFSSHGPLSAHFS